MILFLLLHYIVLHVNCFSNNDDNDNDDDDADNNAMQAMENKSSLCKPIPMTSKKAVHIPFLQECKGGVGEKDRAPGDAAAQ